MVHLVGTLAAGYPDLVAVDDHDVIAHIHVRRVFRLVLSAQAVRDFSREAAERLVFSIDDEPVVLNIACLGAVGFHDLCPRGPYLKERG